VIAPRIGLFGKGRLGSAIAEAAGPGLAWWVGRGESPSLPVEVAIDASVAGALEAHLGWALASGTDLVIGTTGWELPDLEARVGGRIGVLVASNFSLTVALMARFATVLGRYAALDPQRDPYLLEHHHRLKADAPSGTAKTLAAALLAGCPRKTEWTLQTPQPHQLSVGVLRAGTEFGTHTLGLDAPAEVLELTHRARSRAPFAEGALAAAAWLRGRKGVFTMDDLASDLLDPLFVNLNEGRPPARGARSASPLVLPHGAAGQSPDAPSLGGNP
jgi:4-hydroxy-tetrahydrodipicolinate reductase